MMNLSPKYETSLIRRRFLQNTLHESVFTSSTFEKDSHEDIKPIRNLLAAIMGRGISDALGTAANNRHFVPGAKHWIFGPLRPDEEFSFAWLAEHLDLNAAEIQRRLRDFHGDAEATKKQIALLLS